MTSQAEVATRPSQGEIREETFTSLIHSGPKGTLFWLSRDNPGSWFMVFKLLDLFSDKEPNCWLFGGQSWLGRESFLAIPIW